MAEYLTQASITARIEAMLREHTGTERELSPMTLLDDDLEMDSLERVELGLKLEKEFAVQLPDGKVRRSVTEGDLIQLVLLARPEIRV